MKKNLTVSVSDITPTFYFKLPYIGPFSVVTQKRVRHFAERYCDVGFLIFKIGSMFVVKNPIPRGLRTCVVFKL